MLLHYQLQAEQMYPIYLNIKVKKAGFLKDECAGYRTSG